MKKLPKKDFQEALNKLRREYGEPDISMRYQAIYWPPEDEIYVPEGVSTSLRLHELGHQEVYGERWDAERQPWSEFVREELFAEIYSYKLRGKPITWRIAVQAARQLFSSGFSTSESFVLITRGFEELEIPLNKSDKSKLWWYLRHLHEEGTEDFGT